MRDNCCIAWYIAHVVWFKYMICVHIFIGQHFAVFKKLFFSIWQNSCHFYARVFFKIFKSKVFKVLQCNGFFIITQSTSNFKVFSLEIIKKRKKRNFTLKAIQVLVVIACATFHNTHQLKVELIFLAVSSFVSFKLCVL